MSLSFVVFFIAFFVVYIIVFIKRLSYFTYIVNGFVVFQHFPDFSLSLLCTFYKFIFFQTIMRKNRRFHISKIGAGNLPAPSGYQSNLFLQNRRKCFFNSFFANKRKICSHNLLKSCYFCQILIPHFYIA